MDMTVIILALLLVVALVTLAALAMRLRAQPERFAAERAILDGTIETLRRDVERQRGRADEARREAAAALAEKSGAEKQIDKRLSDYERLKEQFLTITKATTSDQLRDLSLKLMADHKREAEEAAKQREAHVAATTKGLVEQMQTLHGSVAALKGQVGEKTEKIDNIWRALTTPSGAGVFAEIALANVLRSFRLEEGRDFVLQLATQDAETGRRLRPDAVVFLPAETVLVVDCKASKFLHDIAQAEGSLNEEEAYRNLARTMNTHLKALAEKDYRSAVAADCRRSGRGEPARVMSLMYLPNDAALEKLIRADRDFITKAAQHEIILAGPAVLACALGFAACEISFARRVENQEKIVDGAKTLIDAISVVLGHALKVGKGIKSAAESYADLTASVNRVLLSRARRLETYGVRPAKSLPPPLPAYHVNVDESLIDGEVEEVVPLPRLVR
jgi:DNA recombination protein RmuC